MELDFNEALRYLGADNNAPEALRQQVSYHAAQLTGTLVPRFTYRVFPLTKVEDMFYLSGSDITLSGQTVQTMLAQCHQAALLCCTLGGEFDALLRRTQVRDMAQAAILDACGSAYVEQGCDAAQEELAIRFPSLFLTDRFSPGYGDLPLSLQPAICSALDTPRRLGVQVTEHFLLNPGKSVTAIIGLSDRPQMARVRGCAYCSMRETCSLRKGGHHCGI